MKPNPAISFCKSTAAMALFTIATIARAQVVFSDNFNSGASPLWGNERGSWNATGGMYNSSTASNNPTTYSSLPYILTDFTLDLDIGQVSDGGVFLHADAAGLNEILLVTGGRGWGLGTTSGGAGSSLYWHVVANGVTGANLQEAFNVFTPGQNAHLTITVTGSTYRAFVDGVLKTTLTNGTYSSGKVGLYDFSPANAANPSIDQKFDNVSLAVPEPSCALFLAVGVGLLGFFESRANRYGMNARFSLKGAAKQH